MFAVVVRDLPTGAELARYVLATEEEAYETHRAVCLIRLVQNEERAIVAIEPEPDPCVNLARVSRK